MATINNRSPYALAVAAREFSKIIDPESVGTVPDDVVAAWAKSEPGLSLLEQGLVSVQVEKAAPKSKSKKPSVKTLIGRVKSIDSVDELTAMEFRTFGPTSTGQVTVNFATAGDTFTITSGNELLPKSITFTGSFTPTLGTEFQSDASPEEIAASLAASINVRGELCKASHVGAVIYLESIETGVDGLHTLSCDPLAAFTLPPDGKLTGGAALIDQALACACSQHADSRSGRRGGAG